MVSYATSFRVREFAVRLALGELPGSLSQRVLGQVLGLVAVAAALGVSASLLVTRYLADLLVGVAPNDPAAIFGAAVLLAAVALVASYLPARRASRMQPASVLREE